MTAPKQLTKQARMYQDYQLSPGHRGSLQKATVTYGLEVTALGCEDYTSLTSQLDIDNDIFNCWTVAAFAQLLLKNTMT